MTGVTHQSWDYQECVRCAAWQVVPRESAVVLACACTRPREVERLDRPATGHEVLQAERLRALVWAAPVWEAQPREAA
ncbi:hypothetical protein [Arhodomonas sp. SL1]|uniref:hypothetical protein n=1 Tax=Arhodomonas sp. SL1 TaxID=3425691 RepID=UPI003F883638